MLDEGVADEEKDLDRSLPPCASEQIIFFAIIGSRTLAPWSRAPSPHCTAACWLVWLGIASVGSALIAMIIAASFGSIAEFSVSFPFFFRNFFSRLGALG